MSDSRGLSLLQAATIGGDLGGYFNIYYESAPFTFKGKTLRIKQAMRLLSPMNYRVGTTVSVDGGPFVNYGNPWWRRDPNAASGRWDEMYAPQARLTVDSRDLRTSKTATDR